MALRSKRDARPTNGVGAVFVFISTHVPSPLCQSFSDLIILR